MIWFHNSSFLRYIVGTMGEFIGVVRGHYDTMSGFSEVVLKKRKKLLQLWKKLHLFTISSQGSIWKYHHPWPSLLYIALSDRTFCSLSVFFLILMKEIFGGDFFLLCSLLLLLCRRDILLPSILYRPSCLYKLIPLEQVDRNYVIHG